MDLTRFAADAGQFINRAVQYTEESLGHAERTELDPGLEELQTLADKTKTWTDQIISQTEVLLQPNPGARLEDRLYEHLDWSAPPRPRTQEVLGDQMTQAGLEMGTNTPYGTALLRCGETQKLLGEADRKFVQSSNIHFLTPLRRFSIGEYRAIQDECRMLLNKRLDLDIAKNRLRKAHEADQESRKMNANPLEDDYLSHVSYMFSFLRVKWLKMWAQEISQAEMELRICQSLFDRQSESTRQLLEGISNTHISHMQSLTDFVEAQTCYYAQCNQHAQELQRQLASIPSVLYSNNWQSALTNSVNVSSTSNHVTNEPAGLNEVTPLPVVVHHLPDFDQDSWRTSSPPGTDKAVTPPPKQTNGNNNNNNADSLAARHCLSPGQVLDRFSSSHPDSRPANHPPISYTGALTNRATTAISELADGSGGSPPGPPPSEFSGTTNGSEAASATLTTGEAPSEPPSVEGGDEQESSSHNQDVVQ
ncbi:endophilin-B1-like [Aulostomus maculatus]